MSMWTILQNKSDYDKAVARLDVLSENPPQPDSDEGKELMLLGYLIDQYEEKEFPISTPDPIEAIEIRMDDLALSKKDLLPIFGDRGTMSKVFNKQRALSISMIRMLGEKLSIPLEVLIQPVYNVDTKKSKKTEMVMEPASTYKKKKRK
jgi:HTH-type transcriptional regulator / antitoxin HigA